MNPQKELKNEGLFLDCGNGFCVCWVRMARAYSVGRVQVFVSIGAGRGFPRLAFLRLV